MSEKFRYDLSYSRNLMRGMKDAITNPLISKERGRERDSDRGQLQFKL